MSYKIDMFLKKANNMSDNYFVQSNLTLGSVESFTGGLFAETITSVSGASKFYKGGLVTYATEEKHKLLGIPNELINQHGVISKEIALYMANNGRQLLNVDCCVSFTGNAGPDAMEGKPVGEVHIGIAWRDTVQVYSLLLKGDRKSIREQAVNFVLEKIHLSVKK